MYDAAVSHNHEISISKANSALVDVLKENGVDTTNVHQVIDYLKTIESEEVYDRMVDIYGIGSISKEQYKLWILEAIKNNQNWLREVAHQELTKPT